MRIIIPALLFWLIAAGSYAEDLPPECPPKPEAGSTHIAKPRFLIDPDGGSYGVAGRMILHVVLNRKEMNGKPPGALLDRRADGQIDPTKFTLYRVYEIDAVNEKPVRFELLDIIEAVCPNKNNDKDSGADGPCGSPLPADAYITDVHILLKEILPYNAAFLLNIEKANPDPCKETVIARKKVFTVLKITLGSCGDGNCLIAHANLPLDDQSEIKLSQEFPIEKEIKATAGYGKAIAIGLAARNKLRLTFERSLPKDQKLVLKAKNFRSLFHPDAPTAKAKDFKGTLGFVPKGKGDARYYVELLWQLADDKKPQLATDVKLAPFGHWRFKPELSANVGSDGLKTANKILLKTAFHHVLFPNKDKLRGTRFEVSPAFETDKDFDKRNVLALVDFQPRFADWEDTREMRREAKQIANEPVALPDFGYLFELRIGAELGRSEAAGEGVFTNRARTASVQVPDHDVARGRVLLRGLIEWKRLLFEATGEFRYLLEDEFVAVAGEGDSISLRTVDELRDFWTVNLGVVLDPERHFILGAKYQRGEAPPKYEDIDTLKVTLSLKY